MKNFNYLTDLLKQKGVLITKETYIIGKHGDFHTNPIHWKTKEPILHKTNAEVLVINQRENYLEWKTVYKSNKGFYIHKKCNLYLDLSKWE